MRMCHLWAQNDPFVLSNIFLVKPLILLSSTYWSFSLCKIFKKFLEWIQSYEYAAFLGQKQSVFPKLELFLKKLLILFAYLLFPFIVQYQLF